jgi:peroxiredoxin
VSSRRRSESVPAEDEVYTRIQMPLSSNRAFLPVFVCLLVPAAFAQTAADAARLGHSSHGDAFDTGPREKPWRIEGIGVAHFPITTSNKEVQQWFDQGNALLHSFWFYEAERAFRWCLKLEPENAMAYWGMARSAGDETRAREFVREAAKRKAGVSERERLYIAAMEAQLLPDVLHESPGDDAYRTRGRQYRKALETICLKYPDDMEARSLLALDTMGESRYGAELMIREILAHQPDHPGAHHYRIHNWDYHEPEQALVSARRYGEIVTGIGHAIHMPGHIYSIVGMWQEAAISMDAATRVEQRYMKERMIFPFNDWNYGHNRFYLSYIQEQLGMVDAAISGARQLIDAPLDPKGNADNQRSTHSYGIAALSRALLKFERWDDLLNAKTIPWRDIPLDKMNKAYFETRAHLGKGQLEAAEKSFALHSAVKKDLEKDKSLDRTFGIQQNELKGRLAIARGDAIIGLGLLAAAADAEATMQREYSDPPAYPQNLLNELGEAYLDAKSPLLAAQAFEKALALTHMDLFALSGLVRARAALGEKAKAEDAMARLRFVAADANPGIPSVDRAKASAVTAEPRDAAPAPQRNYRLFSLERFGPQRWEPYDAPELDVRDSSGQRVTLASYRGKNVLLVFYLGHDCPHCVRQLHDIARKKDDWERLNTEVLAVSNAAPETNAKALKEFGGLPVRLLSDDHFTNARRFHAYDDFEDVELHSTILIDKQGRVRWARTGGEPFGDLTFLEKQLGKLND